MLPLVHSQIRERTRNQSTHVDRHAPLFTYVFVWCVFGRSFDREGTIENDRSREIG